MTPEERGKTAWSELGLFYGGSCPAEIDSTGKKHISIITRHIREAEAEARHEMLEKVTKVVEDEAEEWGLDDAVPFILRAIRAMKEKP